jgi:glyoxylase-like metal-dependent hydrolase (beta-lactamase superfamily II)
MNAIHYPLGDKQPAVSELLEVAPGVQWVRMKLPFALNHINLWLLRDNFEGREGWTIVDCGISNDEIRQAWETIFENHLGGLPVVRVLVTHMHPDHIGLASWLCERWNAPLWISMTDFMMARWLSNPAGGASIGSIAGGGGSADHFQRHGLVSEDDLEKIRARFDYYSKMVPSVPPRFRRICDQEKIKIGALEWQAISGFGHSPEHMALSCESAKLLISGDMVLPRISTNISVFDVEPDADPLGLYLSSLSKFEHLAKDTLVLPSHGFPFQGLHFRINELRAHHVDRLNETLEACAQKPHTARDIVPIMFRRELDLHQMTFAMGEAIAHLNYLWRDGQLKRELCSDGILRFSVPA